MVGTSAEMMLTPFGALVAGFLAGTVSTLGYKFFTVQMPLGPWAEEGVFGVHTRLIIVVLFSSPPLSQNSKSKTRAVSTTSTGCLGSWERSWGSLWLGWPPMKLTEMGEFSPPSPPIPSGIVIPLELSPSLSSSYCGPTRKSCLFSFIHSFIALPPGS